MMGEDALKKTFGKVMKTIVKTGKEDLAELA